MKQGLNHNFTSAPLLDHPYLVYNAVRLARQRAGRRSGAAGASYGTTGPPAHRHGRPDPGRATHPRAAGRINGAQDVRRPTTRTRTTRQAKQSGRRRVKSGLNVTLALPPVQHGGDEDGTDACRATCPRSASRSSCSGPPLGLLREVHGVPSVARRHMGPLPRGWGPDWYGDAPRCPSSTRCSPARRRTRRSASNFGFYNNPSVTALIAKGASWRRQLGRDDLGPGGPAVMKDAPFYPIVNPNQPLYHASYVHTRCMCRRSSQFDPTNVWMSHAR